VRTRGAEEVAREQERLEALMAQVEQLLAPAGQQVA